MDVLKPVVWLDVVHYRVRTDSGIDTGATEECPVQCCRSIVACVGCDGVFSRLEEI